MRTGKLVLGAIALAAVAVMAVAAVTVTIATADDEAVQNYTIFCAKCHGTGGHGDGPNAATLSTKPRDFSDCATMRKISDDTVFRAIKGGGTAVNLPNDMPPWGQAFEDDEIKQLAAYVRTFCGK